MCPLRVGAGKTHSVSASAPRVQNGRRPLRQRDRAPCVFGLAKRDVDGPVPNVFPPQAEALFRPQAEIDQNGRHVTKQVRVAGSESGSFWKRSTTKSDCTRP